MKIRTIAILIAIVAILSAAFLLVDFHLAYSNTQAEHNATTASSGEQLPDSMQRKDTITLAVVGDRGLASALGKKLVAEMRGAGLGDVELVAEASPQMNAPAMVVKVGPSKTIWTPFYATSQLTVEAGFASTGDTSFMDGGTVFTFNDSGPGIGLSAEYNLRNSTLGIISRPGYDSILADWLTERILAELTKIYAPAGVAVP